MNLIQSLFVRGAQEAGELVGVFAQLAAMGPKAVDQTDAAPIVSTEDGEDGAGEAMGQPLVLKAIKEMNEILAAVELLRDRGVPLAGIGDPVAVGEAKNMIVKSMEQSMADGQLVLTEDDKNPRPEGVNEPGTGLPEGEGGAGGEGGEGSGDGGYDDGSAGGAADGDQAGDTSGGDTGADGAGEGDGTGDDTGADDLGGDDGGTDGAGDGGEGDAGDGQGDEGDGSDGDEGNTDGDGDEEEEEEEEDEPGSNDV
ncbi:hypothetical protein D3C85_1159480 [compost metagenome]